MDAPHDRIRVTEQTESWTMSDLFAPNADALVAEIPDGARIAIGKDDYGVAMEATRALIRKRVRNLHIVAVPTSGLQADLLIGAGCVGTVESGGITMGEFGQAPCFVRAVKAGTIRLMDSTCPAIYAGLQAGEKGIPFIPLRGLLGSDIVANRPDFRIIDNPFGENDPIVALPAIVPDVALFHAPMADSAGNVWLGRNAELKLLAHAARRTFVTVERLYEGNLLEDEALGAVTLSSLYVSKIAVVPGGASPLGLPGEYAPDPDQMALYMERAKTDDGFAAYLEEFVLPGGGRAAAAE